MASSGGRGAAPSSVILATAGYDHTIKFWDAQNNECERTIQFPDSQVNVLEVSPNRRKLAAGGNHSVRLYETHTSNSTPVYTADKHTSNVTAIGFHKYGNWMYTGSEDGTIKIWDLRASGFQRSFEAKSKSPVNTVALHPNQVELISGDRSGVLRVWDLNTNNRIWETNPEAETSSISSISVARDGSRVVAGAYSGKIYMWSPLSIDSFGSSEDVPFQTKQMHNKYILKCRISPDLKHLATASADNTVKLWNVADLSMEKVLANHQRWVWDCAFSADSQYLATASSDMTAKLWHLASGNPIRNFHGPGGHKRAVTAVALNDASPYDGSN